MSARPESARIDRPRPDAYDIDWPERVQAEPEPDLPPTMVRSAIAVLIAGLIAVIVVGFAAGWAAALWWRS